MTETVRKYIPDQKQGAKIVDPDDDMMDLIVKSSEQSGIPIEELLSSNINMSIDFNKQQVLNLIAQLEAENYEMTQDVNVAEVELLMSKEETK